MTGEGLAVFAAIVVLALSAWTTLFYLVPLIARSRFQYRATVIRDECIEAVFDGRLPRSAPVEEFVATADSMAKHPEEYTLLRALAAHRAMKDLGCQVPEPPSYGSLKPEERRLLHKLDSQLFEAFSDRLIRGSSFGWLIWLALGLRNLLARSASTASPQSLAREFGAVSDRIPLKGRKLIGSDR